MVVGFRVVRTEDCLHDAATSEAGTITGINTNDNSVEVTWDSGQVETFPNGNDGAEGLRVFDSGPRGIRHRYIRCEGCDVTDIIGTRWRCSVCDNISLCTPCYHDDCHDKTHSFLRIDFPGCQSVKVATRSTSRRARIMGMYPDAKVTRGRHWDSQDHQGDQGSSGTIVYIIDLKGHYSCRNGVSVMWSNETSRDYRVGHDGKVDLCCLQTAPGADCYYEHIGSVDIPQFQQWQDNMESLKVGNKVYIDRPATDVGEWLRTKGSWGGNSKQPSTSVESFQFEGAVGVVKSMKNDGHPEVDFNFTTVAIDKIFLEKVPSHSVGDTVRVIDSKEKLQLLQERLGGWDDDLIQVLGKLGIVKVIDTDGDVAVSFGKPIYVVHPASLIQAPGETQRDDTGLSHQTSTEDMRNTGHSHEHITQESIKVEPTPDFLQSFGGLAFLQALANSHPAHMDMFVKTVIENRVTEATALIKQYPELKDLKMNGVPVLSIAAHQGHRDIIALLLDAGSKIDVFDEHNRCTPLHVAVQRRNGDAAMMLIERGAKLNLATIHKHTALHMAATLNMESVVKLLLDRNADPNVQDSDGDTPLHCAIYAQHDQIAELLIQHLSTNLRLKNNRCFTPLAFACLRGRALPVDKMIAREPQLVNSTLGKGPDGFMPLHIAVSNNHIREATLLLEKGKADVSVCNINDVRPLHLATKDGYYGISELLLNHGADVSVKDSFGNTPLHMCLLGRRGDPMIALFSPNPTEDEERIKLAKLLMHHGASLSVGNHLGQKPLECCLFPHIREAITAYMNTRDPSTD